MVRMADSDGERVGGVISIELGAGQQNPHHRPDLHLLGMTGADDRLFHSVRRVFSNAETCLRRHKQRYSSRLSELQGCHCIAIDERLLDRRFIRRPGPHHFSERRVQNGQAPGKLAVERGLHCARAKESQGVALNRHHPPTGAAEAWIDTEDANRGCHGESRSAYRAPLPEWVPGGLQFEEDITMRVASIALSLLAVSIAVPTLADAFDMPARKAGQWKIEIIPETAGAAPSMTMELCLDAATDKTLMQSGTAMAGGQCQTLSQSQNGNQTIIDSACDIGGMKTRSHVVIAGDFQSSYSMQITSDMEGGSPKLPKHSVITQNATWMGECSDGMLPGDMLMPGGMKVNALKAMNPGG
jgi:hypothetical protein